MPTLISLLYFSITCFLWLSPKREEWWRESTLRKTLLFIFSTVQKSMSLRPPTPIPVLRLRKQVNQTQRPVGCETSPGPAPSRRRHQSFHLDFRGKAKTHTHKTKKSHPTLLSELVSVLNSALAAAQPAAVWTRLKKQIDTIKDRVGQQRPKCLPTAGNKTAGATWALGRVSSW